MINLPSKQHTGFEIVTGEPKQKIYQHNYMRSLWALLILLGLCSFLAQRKWAAIFDDEVLKALLKLSGSEKLRFVEAAEKAKPYETLSKLSRDLDSEVRRLDGSGGQLKKNTSLHSSPSEQIELKMDLVDSYVSIYDHNLDYYPNQLIYLLLTKNTAAYKMCLKLRQKLIIYTLYSTTMTIAQFALPLLFIGREYSTYGWNYMQAFGDYLIKLLTSPKPILDNSIDYELSSRIFPIATQCEYILGGFSGTPEPIILQCTVAINEICSKLFVVIWWFVAVNIVVELWSLVIICFGSISYSTLRWAFGYRYWPRARREANLIASFRFKRNKILLRQQRRKQLGRNLETAANAQKNSKRQVNGQLASAADVIILDKHEQKRLEAEQLNNSAAANDDDLSIGRGSAGSRRQKQSEWDFWKPRNICAKIFEVICCSLNMRRQPIEVEPEKDLNVFFLLYLIYLRLNRSRTRVEQVIKMSSQALNNYLDDLVRQPKVSALAAFNQQQQQALDDEENEDTRGQPRDLPANKVPCADTIIDVKM